MRIGVQTWGSEGDVRPLLALAAGLRTAGHDVSFSVTSIDGRDYTARARSLGIALRQAEFPRMRAEEVRALGRTLLRSRDPAGDLALVAERLLAPSDAAVEAEARTLCTGRDLVIGHAIVHALGACAEKAGLPWVSVQLAPDGIPTRHLPPGEFPNLGPVANALLWRVAEARANRAMLGWTNAVRVRIGVPPARSYLGGAGRSQFLNLVAASPSLLPPPPDWSRHDVVCGAFDLPMEAEIEGVPDALESFLAAGPPPLYFAVGSMLGVEDDERALVSLLAEAARRVGQRAVIQAPAEGHAAVAGDPSVYVTTGTPHAVVFPRCAAVVHPGGAGTSHVVARAGVPSVVVPYFLDQRPWARTLARAGVAPEPLPRTRLTAQALAARLARVLGDANLRRQARVLAERMRGEDGVAHGIAAIAAEFGKQRR